MGFDYIKHQGFTLAEVLITLGIIGIVAAMTMPSVIGNARDKQIIARVQKIYSVLSSSYMMAVAESETPEYWGMPYTTGNNYAAAEVMASYFIKNMKILKDCKGKRGCFPNSVTYRFNNTNPWNDNFDKGSHRYKVITSDGVSVAFHAYSNNCSAQAGNINFCGRIYVNINGVKDKKSILGKNLFQFLLTNKGVIPDGVDVSYEEMEDTCMGISNKAGDRCTRWVLSKGNLNYLYNKK